MASMANCECHNQMVYPIWHHKDQDPRSWNISDDLFADLLIHLLDNLQVSMLFHGFNRFFLAGTDCQQTIQIQTINLSVRSLRIGIEEWDKMRMSWDDIYIYI